MREIKFRAWDKDLKRMFYLDKGHFMIGRTGQACMFCNIWLDELIKNGFTKEGRHKPKILMQDTGRKDKNGELVFDGDLFTVVYSDCISGYRIVGKKTTHIDVVAEVVFKFGGWKLKHVNPQTKEVVYGDLYATLEKNPKAITGNIHESHNLLEKK